MTNNFVLALERIPQEKDPWKRRILVSSTALEASNLQVRELLNELLFDPDPVVSLLAFQGLKKTHRLPHGIGESWRNLFSESLQLLIRQAQRGPFSLRVAAIQALAFAPTGMSVELIDSIFQSNLREEGEVSVWPDPPSIPLINEGHAFSFPESFSLLLSGFSSAEFRSSFLRREFAKSHSPENLLPMFLSLQISPIEELVSDILPYVRRPEKNLALESMRALFACGGSKVIRLISSLFHNTSDSVKKAQILGILTECDKEEVFELCKKQLSSPHEEILKTAISGIGNFPITSQEKVELIQPFLENSSIPVLCEAAVWLWKLGSMDALNKLESLLRGSSGRDRAYAAEALGRLSPSIAIPRLLELLIDENHGDAKRKILLALRHSLPLAQKSGVLPDRLIPALNRLLFSRDVFFRNQAAVLCGVLGPISQDLILSALAQEEHPHVLASHLKSLGRIGSPKILVFAKFFDHPDPRVRANLMEAFFHSGQPAIPYLAGGLKDPSARVRSAAAISLFMLGQSDVVGILNRMLLTSSPLAVLSGCFSFSRIFRQFTALNKSENPIGVALQVAQKRKKSLAPKLAETSLGKLFAGLSRSGGSLKGNIEFLRKFRKNFDSYFARRLLASFLLLDRQLGKSLLLLEQCLKEHPSVLADQFDAYRLSLGIGDMKRAEFYKRAIVKNYQDLLSACYELCRKIRGKGAEELLERLLRLQKPSMNLYNAMIQLKMIQGELEVVQELVMELFGARPVNRQICQKLIEIFPKNEGETKTELKNYLRALEVASQ